MPANPLKLASQARGDLRSAATAARDGRFDALSVDIATLAATRNSESAKREVRALLSRHGLAPAALRCKLPGKGLSSDADGDRVFDELCRAMKLCRGVGFALVSCDLGAVPRSVQPKAKAKAIDPGLLGALILPTSDDVASLIGGNEDAASEPLTAKEREHAALATDVLREVGDAADRLGIAVAFDATLASSQDLGALLKAADCGLFFRELDTAASVTELAADVSAVVGSSPAILHVRAADAQSAGGRTRQIAMGKGDVPFATLLEALEEADFAGFVTLPPDVSRRAWQAATA